MKKLLILIFLLSPIVSAFFYKNFAAKENTLKIDPKMEMYYGERRVDNKYYARGMVSAVNKADRIISLKTVGDTLSDYFVTKDAQFILKLKISKGGDVKKFSGDYFLRINPGDFVDMELFEKGSKFTKSVLVYDLESFSP